MNPANVAMPEPKPPSKLSGWAIASLVLSFCGVFSLLGLIFGIVGLVRINGSNGRLRGKGMAIAGICVSAFMLLISVAILPALLLPVLGRARESAKRVASAQNMRQIGTAMKIAALDKADEKESLDPYKLHPQYISDSRVFRNMRYPNESIGYVYVTGVERPNPDQIVAMETLPISIVLYEYVPKSAHSFGRNVLELNGNVEFMLEESFQKTLQLTKEMVRLAGRESHEVPIDTTHFK